MVRESSGRKCDRLLFGVYAENLLHHFQRSWGRLMLKMLAENLLLFKARLALCSWKGRSVKSEDACNGIMFFRLPALGGKIENMRSLP